MSRRELAYDSRHALNAICPYYTMFPIEYPLKILRRFRKDSPVVFDPFCGRGTTIYAARYLGLRSWGMDTSPIATAIARAKIASASLDEVIEAAEDLLLIEPKDIPQSRFFRTAFAPSTLKQICALREGLLKDDGANDAYVLLRAAAMGCLHGPKSKSVEQAGYFSNQMPRTYASKPDYSISYWKANDLKAPKIDVLPVLKRKLSRICSSTLDFPTPASLVVNSDARDLAFRSNLSKETSIVITSPPYYGMRTYVQDQWLRNWFLGGSAEIEYTNTEQLSHSGKDVFVGELASIWKRLLRSQSENLDLYLRFGSIRSAKSEAKQIIRESLEESGGWKLISVRGAATAAAGKRQADQMGSESSAPKEYDFHVKRA